MLETRLWWNCSPDAWVKTKTLDELHKVQLAAQCHLLGCSVGHSLFSLQETCPFPAISAEINCYTHEESGERWRGGSLISFGFNTTIQMQPRHVRLVVSRRSSTLTASWLRNPSFSLWHLIILKNTIGAFVFWLGNVSLLRKWSIFSEWS